MPNSLQPLVSIITLQFNQLPVTLDFLESSRSLTYPSFEIIVCDMHSEFDPGPQIYNLHLPNTHYYRSESNLGFAAGNNWGLTKAKGDFIFFVNNDTVLTSGIIESLLQPMLDNEQIAAVSPKIKYFDPPNLLQYAGFGDMSLYTGRNITIGKGEEDNGRFDISGPTAAVHGTAMLVRRSVIDKAGMFPEKFFLYYEEWDWSFRAKKAGYKLWYAANALIYHKESQSLGRSNPLKLYYHTRNRILCVRRNASEGQFFFFLLFFTLLSIPKAIVILMINGRFKELTLFTQAVLWNLRNTSNSAVR